MTRAALLITLIATTAHAETRVFAGSIGTRWQTIGYHGHDQEPCEPIDLSDPEAIYPDCDGNDLARGNMDNSIGYRFGFERDFHRIFQSRLAYGVESTLMFTEYNLSQHDVTIISATPTIGASVPLPWAQIWAGAKAGLGPFFTTEGDQDGDLWFVETSLTIPVGRGAGFRIAYRSTTLPNREEISGVSRSPRVVDTSFLFVASPSLHTGESPWEFATSAGLSSPGTFIGESAKLLRNDFHQMSARRALPWYGLQGEISWTGTAHESSEPGVFFGYPGNFRTNVVDAYGVGAYGARGLSDVLALRYGANLEIADWEDEFNFLLDDDGSTIEGGSELGVGAGLALRFHTAPHYSIEVTAQQMYWPGIDVGELRTGVGLVVTP